MKLYHFYHLLPSFMSNNLTFGSTIYNNNQIIYMYITVRNILLSEQRFHYSFAILQDCLNSYHSLNKFSISFDGIILRFEWLPAIAPASLSMMDFRKSQLSIYKKGIMAIFSCLWPTTDRIKLQQWRLATKFFSLLSSLFQIILDVCGAFFCNQVEILMHCLAQLIFHQNHCRYII